MTAITPPASLPLPPRIFIHVLCVRRRDGYCVAYSGALPGIVAGGVNADDATLTLRRLAEGVAGEPVSTVVTLLPEDEAVRG